MPVEPGDCCLPRWWSSSSPLRCPRSSCRRCASQASRSTGRPPLSTFRTIGSRWSPTDYFAADTEPSPLLHFWSLAVEEQFYLVWPVLILAAAKVLPRRRIWIVVGLVAASSFALSVVVTDVNAPWAFYSLPTRAWQLALGALVALGILALPARWPDWLGAALSWIGLAMIGAAVRPHQWIDAVSRLHRPASSRGSGPVHHRRRSPGRVASSSARDRSAAMVWPDLVLTLSLALADPDPRGRSGRP